VGGVGCTFAMQTITRRIARKRAHRDAAGRTSEERERAAKYRGKRIVTLSREDSERGHDLSFALPLLPFSLSFFSQPPLALPPPPRMDLIIGWTTSMKLFAISVICSDLSRLGNFTARFIGIISRSRDGAYCIAPLPERDAGAFYYCRLTYFYRCCPRKKSHL
jgi:hypothetical protein